MDSKPPFDFSDFKDFKPPKINFRAAGAAVAIIVALSFVFSLWFTVEPEEVGVVLRFGEYKRTVNPGLNFKMPFGIEQVFKVPVERQLKLEFGFRYHAGSKDDLFNDPVPRRVINADR